MSWQHNVLFRIPHVTIYIVVEWAILLVTRWGCLHRIVFIVNNIECHFTGDFHRFEYCYSGTLITIRWMLLILIPSVGSDMVYVREFVGIHCCRHWMRIPFTQALYRILVTRRTKIQPQPHRLLPSKVISRGLPLTMVITIIDRISLSAGAFECQRKGE